MSNPPPESFLLVDQFRVFYAETLRLAEEVSGEGPSGSSPPSTKDVSALLISMLKRQAQDSAFISLGISAQTVADAQFVMAAMADETFLTIDWPGKAAWEEKPITYQYLQVRNYGSEFFLRLDHLLANMDPDQVDVAEVYLVALALGFLGMYRDKPNDPRLGEYRRRLYLLIFRSSPEERPPDPRLFPATYLSNLGAAVIGRLPLVRRWLALLGGVAGLALLVSYLLWLRHVGGLRIVIEQILSKGIL